MPRRRRERAVYFPWERRSAISRLPWLRSRVLLTAFVTALTLLLVGARERDRAGVRATRARLLVVRQAIDAYRADHQGRCPRSFAELRQARYLAVEATDAWGRPLRLTCPGRRHPESYDLISFGPSGDQSELDRIE